MSKFDPKQYMTDLRGQQYLEVKYRVLWFRTDHPAGSIETEVVSMDPLLVRAIVTDADGKRLATGHGGADAGGRKVVWSGREFEKAETAAIGRALAHAGFGTQFTGEVEGDHLADSPVTPPTTRKATPMKVVGGRTNDKPAAPDALVQATQDELGGEIAGATADNTPLPEPRKDWPSDGNLILALKNETGHTPPEIFNRLNKMAAEGAITLSDPSGRVIGKYKARMADKQPA